MYEKMIREGNRLAAWKWYVFENNLMEVPIDCVWNDWDDLVGPCINGTYTRTRTKKITEQFGGHCVGENTTTVACPYFKAEGKSNFADIIDIIKLCTLVC